VKPRAGQLHSVEMLVFAESVEALGLLARQIRSVIGTKDLEVHCPRI